MEKELLSINKIHNNKIHSSTFRIPKDIKNLQDPTEIAEIKQLYMIIYL